CIIEKKVGKDKYKYYYYFTAAQKIGVAVADDPTGPFTDSGKALIDSKTKGVNNGQEIDPEVFSDPNTGKKYLYWGNAYLAVAELNEDYVSIKKQPNKENHTDETISEENSVFYREDLYYLLCSEEDTKNENYRISYAT